MLDSLFNLFATTSRSAKNYTFRFLRKINWIGWNALATFVAGAAAALSGANYDWAKTNYPIGMPVYDALSPYRAELALLRHLLPSPLHSFSRSPPFSRNVGSIASKGNCRVEPEPFLLSRKISSKCLMDYS